MFHRVLIDIVQSRQPGFLERQVSIPEFIHHSPAASAINAIEPYRQFAVQMSHEIAVRRCAVFEADHDVIVIGEEGPRLQNQRVIFRQVESCIGQEIQLCTGVEKPLSMQCRRGNDINAVRREVLWPCVRPTFTHKSC